MRSAPVSSACLAVAAIAAIAACSSTAPAPAVSCDGVELIVAASDFVSSMVCGAPRCEAGPHTSGVDLGSDPQLTSGGGRTFFLARDKELVFELDPVCGRPTAKYSVHEQDRKYGNPHDVAAAPDGSLFVVLYNRPEILVLRDNAIVDRIDISSFDPEDGNPQADSIRIVEVGGVPKAFVALEILDDTSTPALRSSRPSAMLRIDVATRAIEARIELAGRNPINPMTEHDGALFLAEPGNFNRADEPLAGIERFDPRTGTTRLLVPERELGGSVVQTAVTDGCGAAIVAGPQMDLNPTSVVTFDPDSGKVFASAAAPVFGPTADYDLWGLAWRGDLLFVGDRRRGASGFPIHVFEREPSPTGGPPTCNLRPVGRTIDLPREPIALRAAR
ncbi:MAG: hypothetical protein KF819_37115 [Labilithrix sp.]|nr:hypothetical protein [Labilithrix sp.]